jgi:hypothetical protein
MFVTLPALDTAPAGSQMLMIPLHLIVSGSALALGIDLPGGMKMTRLGMLNVTTQ